MAAQNVGGLAQNVQNKHCGPESKYAQYPPILELILYLEKSYPIPILLGYHTHLGRLSGPVRTWHDDLLKEKVFFTPLTLDKFCFSSLNNKTVRTDSLNF